MLKAPDWMIGGVAAICLITAGMVTAFNGGLELRAGGLNLAVSASEEAGLKVVVKGVG